MLPGPLVLGKRLRKFLRPQWVGDQPVLRMFLTCCQVHGLYLHPDEFGRLTFSLYGLLLSKAFPRYCP